MRGIRSRNIAAGSYIAGVVVEFLFGGGKDQAVILKDVDRVVLVEAGMNLPSISGGVASVSIRHSNSLTPATNIDAAAASNHTSLWVLPSNLQLTVPGNLTYRPEGGVLIDLSSLPSYVDADDGRRIRVIKCRAAPGTAGSGRAWFNLRPLRYLPGL